MSGLRTDGAWLLREAMRTVLARAADVRAVAEHLPLQSGRAAPGNLLAGKILLRRVAGRRPLPGELAINYLVTARR